MMGREVTRDVLHLAEHRGGFAMLPRSLFRRPLRRKSAPPHRFRPGVECLEAREVPAVITWLGGYSNMFGQPLNWDLGRVPQAGDDVIFGASAYQGISNFGPAPPGGPGLPGSGGPYNSVQVLDGFGYTVTISMGFETNQLVLTGGGISQAANQHQTNRDIHVLESFDWTGGGVLNSSSDHANVRILGGATATITPPAVGELITGSTLSFEVNAQGVGAQGTIEPGTVQFNNAAGAVVGGTVTPVTQKASVLVRGNVDFLGTNGWITIKPEGLWRVIGPGTFTSPLPIYNTGGVLQVDTGATANITGRFPVDAVSVQQVSGAIHIQGGSTLKATTFGVLLNGGKLSTLANTAVGGSQTATIDGKLTNSGADVVIGEFSSPHVFGVLYCTDDVLWTGGTYRPVLDATDTSKADLWKVKKNFEVGGTAEIAPGTINGAPPQNQTWLIMEAVDGSISLQPGANDPPIDSPVVPYTLVKQGNKKWFLKSS
jgi:hypothetical protein